MAAEASRGLEDLNVEHDFSTTSQETITTISYWSDTDTDADAASKKRAHDVAVSMQESEERKNGKGHPLTLWAWVLVARALWNLGQYDDALHALELPFSLGETIVGKDHHAYKYAEMLKAICLRDQGQHSDAPPLLIQCDRAFARIPRYFDRIDTLRHLTKLYEAQKGYAEAIDTCRTMKAVLETVLPGDSGTLHPLQRQIRADIARLWLLAESSGRLSIDPLASSLDQGLRQRGTLRANDSNSD